MGRYEQKDLFFEAPDGWHDRTVVAFVAPARPGRKTPSTLVVTRELLGPSENLQTYATRQLGLLGRAFNEFELLETMDVTVGGLPAVQVLFAWVADNGPLVQRVTFAALDDTVHGFTATMPFSDVAEMTPIFDRVLATVGFPGLPPGRGP